MHTPTYTPEYFYTGNTGSNNGLLILPRLKLSSNIMLMVSPRSGEGSNSMLLVSPRPGGRSNIVLTSSPRPGAENNVLIAPARPPAQNHYRVDAGKSLTTILDIQKTNEKPSGINHTLLS